LVISEGGKLNPASIIQNLGTDDVIIYVKYWCELYKIFACLNRLFDVVEAIVRHEDVLKSSQPDVDFPAASLPLNSKFLNFNQQSRDCHQAELEVLP